MLKYSPFRPCTWTAAGPSLSARTADVPVTASAAVAEAARPLVGSTSAAAVRIAHILARGRVCGLVIGPFLGSHLCNVGKHVSAE